MGNGDIEEISWNDEVTCTKDGSGILMSSPTEPKSFTSSDKIIWEVSNIKNPEWGESRVARNGWDFDVTDGSVFPLHETWTDSFNFFIYSSSAIGQRSYQNLNAAYVGYSSSKTTLEINSYKPNTRENRITIVPGSQTEDIVISTGSDDHPVGSSKLVLTPFKRWNASPGSDP